MLPLGFSLLRERGSDLQSQVIKPMMAAQTAFAELLAEAERALDAGDYSRALALSDELLASYPDALSGWQVRARALSELDEPLHAADAYGRILDITPADVEAIKHRARALSAAGQHDEAMLLARQALDYLPAMQHAAAAAAPSSTRGSLREALDYLDAGLLAQSIALLRRLAERAPERLDIRVCLAQALWRWGLCVSAAQTCLVILDELPDCLNAHALLLAFWRRFGPAGFAEFHLSALARLDPDHRHTRALLGDEFTLIAQEASAAQASEDTEQVAEWVETLVAASTVVPRVPDRPAPVIAGRTSSVQGDEQATMTPSEGHAPSDAQEEALGPLVPLEWQLAEELPTDGPAADIQFDRLSIRMKQPAGQRLKRPRRAADFGRPKTIPVASAREQQIVARYEQAIAHAHADQLDRIIAELEQMRAAQPADRTVYELLGMAYTRKGDLGAALEAYRHAMTLAADKR
jgi:tetratricopeptide (TPR) repeat protein